MWLYFGLFVVFLAVLDYYRKLRWDMRTNIPGPMTFPLIGNVHQYFNLTPETMYKKARALLQEYKGIFRTWAFNSFFVAISDPKYIEPIVSSSSHMGKNEIYDLLKPWLKEGLLTSQGTKWFHRRRIITPAFHFSMLEQFVKVFDEQSNILVKKLKPHAVDGEVFDIGTYISLAALDALSETVLGVKINAQTDAECAYVKAVHSMNALVTARLVTVYQISPILFTIFAYPTKRRQDKLLHTLHSFTQNIIEERRKVLEQEVNITEDNEDTDIGRKKRLTFLDLLLHASINGQQLSNDDIREEVDTFAFGGHDTITSVIGFTLFLISRHPEVQRKIFAEITEVFGDDATQPATFKDLQQLKYTELVIKEGMRIYPPVPMIGRKIDKDLRIGDKFLPIGSSAFIFLSMAMRNPEYFPEPDKFIPERHSIENNAETINPFAYIPFSAGPRKCVGHKYAMLEMKSIITKILRHYELISLGKDVKPVPTTVVQSITGYQMGLKPRAY